MDLLPREIKFIIIKFTKNDIDLLCVNRNWLSAFRRYYKPPGVIPYSVNTLNHFRGYIRCRQVKLDHKSLRIMFHHIVCRSPEIDANLTIHKFFYYAKNPLVIVSRLYPDLNIDLDSNIYKNVFKANIDVSIRKCIHELNYGLLRLLLQTCNHDEIYYYIQTRVWNYSQEVFEILNEYFMPNNRIEFTSILQYALLIKSIKVIKKNNSPLVFQLFRDM